MERSTRKYWPVLFLASAVLGFSGLVNAQQQHAGEMTLDEAEAAEHFTSRGYSPYADRGFPTRPLWGDTHLHTANSPDAFAFGNRLTPEDAYRFAMGKTITSATGQRVQLSRPLDFLVVADHGVAMGAMMELYQGNPALLNDERLKRWHLMMNESPEQGVKAAGELISEASQGNIPAAMLDPTIARTVWNSYTKTADAYNDPGTFTAIIGYEWTSLIKGNNLHRVVMFRGDKSDADQIVPFTFADSTDPEDLWAFMGRYESKTGDLALAIPHNGNLSNGMMFMPETIGGKSFNREYVETRARWEPVYEVTQIKGDGESHPFLSPNDEFAGLELWDKGNLDMSQKKSDDMLQYEYAREALKLGMALEQKLGTNPFKFGMVGSTDSHTALPAVEEENFFGKHTGKEPSDHRWNTPVLATPAGNVMGWEQVSSGLAAAWATENTREGVWDAFKRKEVYATTGPRITVRVFAGWDFEADEVHRPDFAETGYDRGVPMGADIFVGPDGAAPTFMIRALRDPDGANLDRIQIVKGWARDSGSFNERG